jgi:hypothetical protein
MSADNEHTKRVRQLQAEQLRRDESVHMMNGIIELLYDLEKEELRRLALECLLISDGPDQVIH